MRWKLKFMTAKGTLFPPISSLSRLDCDSGSLKLKERCLQWWVEDLLILGFDFYHRVISVMGHSGVQTDNIVASLMHYAQTSLKGIGKPQIWNPARTYPRLIENGQKMIIKSLLTLLPTKKSSIIPLNFLFGMMSIAIMVDASLACRLELEKRIGYRLEMALLDNVLIQSVQTDDYLFDVDTIHRILVHFLQRIEEEESEESGYESEGMESPSHGSFLSKFIAMIKVLPDYAHVIDDGLYRAINIYLKMCKFIDCQKLSQEACNYAAQNEKLQVHLVIQVLYFEQLQLKNALLGSSGDRLLSQKMSNGVLSVAMSPRDTYASLRRANREMKLEILRMQVRLSDLEKEQSSQRKTLLTSISKGIERIGIFKGQDGDKQR
ncbi:hypothetical protein CDL12_01447 [Handroanthus impetiginosus]|uniref:NPH3 domain-containing protein n=1 Tax=Handroanthus impetiginosus TaxID=429701 RepID=A0A2G9I7S4_9LAMI|nr:hypothetical protein CDL12_01447 [Handroanthus impetiginosus]